MTWKRTASTWFARATGSSGAIRCSISFRWRWMTPPTDEELSKILHQVGKGAREAKRVEVAFDLIAPKPAQFWTLKSDGDVGVAVGRSGATRVQTFRLGQGRGAARAGGRENRFG